MNAPCVEQNMCVDTFDVLKLVSTLACLEKESLNVLSLHFSINLQLFILLLACYMCSVRVDER